jgi:hypothetical protein
MTCTAFAASYFHSRAAGHTMPHIETIRFSLMQVDAELQSFTGSVYVLLRQ